MQMGDRMGHCLNILKLKQCPKKTLAALSFLFIIIIIIIIIILFCFLVSYFSQAKIYDFFFVIFDLKSRIYIFFFHSIT